MDKKLEILLGSERSTESVNVQEFTKAELTRKTSELTEFTVNDVVDSTQVFDEERNNNPVYRIYGRIEYLSLLNGLVNNYNRLDDFFTPDYTGDSKNILNSFKFYLVKPASSGYTNITGTDKYIRYFEVIATPDDFEIFPAGFTTNVYDEQTYGFAFNMDFDVSDYFDDFGFPVTELFLYAEYVVKENGNSVWETLRYTKFTAAGGNSQSTYSVTTLNIGDALKNGVGEKIGDVIEYNKSTYNQTQTENQILYITTEYLNSSDQTRNLVWKYNPFIPLRLRYLSDNLSTSDTTKLVENSINMEITYTSNPTITSTIEKSTQKTISSEETVITDWTSNTGSAVTPNLSSGEITFNTSGDYELVFNAKIRFPQNSYRYFGVIEIQKQIGSSWDKISGSTIIFENSYEKKGVTINTGFTAGNIIRVVTKLIPNPNELVPEETEIPEYAIQLNNGQYVWREIVQQGYTEPISGNGVDYPFMNGRRYLFAPLILSTSPDLSNTNTATVFSEIYMENNYGLLDFTPNPENDLDDIGKPCQ